MGLSDSLRVVGVVIFARELAMAEGGLRAGPIESEDRLARIHGSVAEADARFVTIDRLSDFEIIPCH